MTLFSQGDPQLIVLLVSHPDIDLPKPDLFAVFPVNEPGTMT